MKNHDQFSSIDTRLGWSLFLLRLGVFSVMILWALDKLINPAHGAKVLSIFYGVTDISNVAIYGFGIIQIAIAVGFVIGFMKRYSYGIILVMHGVTTLVSYKQYLDPFSNMLFFAAWPMLAACIALYLLRDADTKLTVS